MQLAILPIDLLTTRIQVSGGGSEHGILATLRAVFAEEGVPGLWGGLSMAVARDVVRAGAVVRARAVARDVVRAGAVVRARAVARDVVRAGAVVRARAVGGA